MGATLGMVGQYGGELSYKLPFPHKCGVVCCTALLCGVCLCVLMCASICASMYSKTSIEDTIGTQMVVLYIEVSLM